MQTPSLPVSGFFASATCFVPPGHVKHWTGRAAPTIHLPNLAALRIAASPACQKNPRPFHA